VVAAVVPGACVVLAADPAVVGAAPSVVVGAAVLANSGGTGVESEADSDTSQ